jgi:hypothetical protein
MADRKGAYRVLVGKPDGKRSLGGPRYRWEDTIKMYLLGVKWGGMHWTGLAQDRDRWRAGSCECGNERSVSIKCWEFLN